MTSDGHKIDAPDKNGRIIHLPQSSAPDSDKVWALHVEVNWARRYLKPSPGPRLKRYGLIRRGYK